MGTTTGHSISYADSTDAVDVPSTTQNLANSVEAALTTYETWNSWPSLLTWDTTTGGGITAVGGSGFAEGFYQRFGSGVGALVHAEFRIEVQAGFTTDSGTFALKLPFPAYQFSGTVVQSTLGFWTARDASVPNHFSGSIGVWDTAGLYCSFNGAVNASVPNKRVDSNDPIVWAAGDVLSGVLTYRAAG